MPKMKKIDDNSTSKRQEIIEIATDYYKLLYQKQTTASAKKQLQITSTSEVVPIILKEETEKAINTQKFDKSAGTDQISNELLKYTAPTIVRILTELFNDILTTEQSPCGQNQL